ncbi:hypothetical protein BH11PSE10_BH11PSE10_17560 [soil metagenome]
MWISEFWYEKLPWLYAAAGLLSMLLGSMARISGVLLLSAAGLIAWWRYDHRQGGRR